MAIRLRVVEGQLIALCAARSVEKPGDIYLDDGQHTALGSKFARDYNDMFNVGLPVNEDDIRLVEQEESNNANREWWDSFFGAEVTSNKPQATYQSSVEVESDMARVFATEERWPYVVIICTTLLVLIYALLEFL